MMTTELTVLLHVRYYYSPWRAPGSAPVFDSCGMAGGHKPPNGGLFFAFFY